VLRIVEEPSEQVEGLRLDLDELAREGARRMLVEALEVEVDAYLERHQDARDERGHAEVVRNGHARERKVTVGSGTLEVRAPRVDDRRVDEQGQRQRFTSQILPPYMRRSPKVAEVLPIVMFPGRPASRRLMWKRRSLVLRHDISAQPVAADSVDAIYRAWRKPEQRGFTHAFFRQVEEREVFTEGGIYLGNAGFYDVDHHRLDRVAQRTIQGLSYHHSGKRLPDGYIVFAFCHTGIPKGTHAERTALSYLRSVVSVADERTLDPRVFRYWFCATDEDVDSSAWVLWFFNKIVFLGGIRPREHGK